MNDITIEIPIGGKPVKLTESEARELRARLNNLFGPEQMPRYEPLPSPWPFQPPRYEPLPGPWPFQPPFDLRPPYPGWKPGDVWCGMPVPADDPTRKVW